MRTILVLVFAVVTGAAYADVPSLEFRPRGAKVKGMRAGTRVVWLAMLRDRILERPRVTMQRGLEPVTPNGELTVDGEIDASQSMWIVAAIDEDVVLRQSAPDYPVSPAPIEAQALPGSDTIRIRSGTISLTYVRRHGAGVWVFAAADGSALDSDRTRDGWISISLAALQKFRGGARPPDTVDPGDLILMIDPVELRSSALKVQP